MEPEGRAICFLSQLKPIPQEETFWQRLLINMAKNPWWGKHTGPMG